jgi:glyoxylase-like metal-dependent hydrolase (beta-lactamase superfamily II)
VQDVGLLEVDVEVAVGVAGEAVVANHDRGVAHPFIDTTNGGSINGTLRATEENLKLTGEKTIVIPGHGPVGARGELTDFRNMLADIRDAVAKLKKEGKPVEEAVAAKPTAKWDAKYAGFVITPEHFTRIAYAGV